MTAQTQSTKLPLVLIIECECKLKRKKILLVERNWKIVRIVDEPEHDVKEVYAAITAVADRRLGTCHKAGLAFSVCLWWRPRCHLPKFYKLCQVRTLHDMKYGIILYAGIL